MTAMTILKRSGLGALLAFALTAPAAQANPFVYVTDSGSASLSQYDARAGALSALTPATEATDFLPENPAATPDGKYIYVTDGAEAKLSEYAARQDGSVRPIGTVATGNGPFAIAVAPDGKHVYVTDAAADSVSEFSIAADGTLTAIGSIGAGHQPIGLALTPDGAHAYVSAQGDNSITEYAIQADGTLVANGSLMTPSQPFSVAVALDGKHAYAALMGGNAVAEYAIGSGGALTPVGSAPTGRVPTGIAIAPDGKHAYVTDLLDSTVSEYAIGAGGALTALGSAPTGRGAVSVALTPDGRHAYVPDEFDDAVSSFSVGLDGRLAPDGTTAAGTMPFGIAVASGVDLAVRLAAAPDPAVVGSDLTYTLTVTDRGRSASDVQVSDALPADARLVSARASQGSCAGAGTLVCGLGRLAAGASATVTVTVAPIRPGELFSSAVVSSDAPDADRADNATSVLTTVRSAPQATTTPASALGPRSAQLNGTVDPEGEPTTWHFSFAGRVTPTQVVAASDQTGLVTARASRLRPGWTYRYRLIATNATGTTIGAEQTFTTPRRRPARVDLSLTQSVRAARGTLTYRLTAVNHSRTRTATGVTVTDALPHGADRLSARASRGTCRGSTTVVCRLGRLRPRQHAVITIRVRVHGRSRPRNAARITSDQPVGSRDA